LNMLSIAVPKSSNQFRVLLPSAGVQPLLELVQNQQHLTCEPTADRLVRKGILPTPDRSAEGLWGPTAAACSGVG